MPTAAGVRFAGHARALLDAANAALDDLADVAQETDGGRPLRVGIMGHGSAELTPAAINAYRRARPEVRVEIRQLDFTEHVTALVEDRVDVAFVRPSPGRAARRGCPDHRAADRRRARTVATGRRPDVRDRGRGPHRTAAVPGPGTHPHSFTDYLYFGDRAQRRSSEYAVTPQEVLTGVVTGRAAGSGLRSFARYYAWPGAVFIPVLDAPWESSYLAVRAGDDNPEVRIFRALAVALAKDMGPGINAL